MVTKATKKAGSKAKSKKALAGRSGALTMSGKIGKRTSAASRKSDTKPVLRAITKIPAEPLTHRLDALLHTMRTIAQHEDELCTLLHDARRTGKISAAVRRELQAVLAALPAQEYTDDLQAVLQMMGEA